MDFKKFSNVTHPQSKKKNAHYTKINKNGINQEISHSIHFLWSQLISYKQIRQAVLFLRRGREKVELHYNKGTTTAPIEDL